MSQERNRKLDTRHTAHRQTQTLQSFAHSVIEAYRRENAPTNVEQLGFSWFQEHGLLSPEIFLRHFGGNPRAVFNYITQLLDHGLTENDEQEPFQPPFIKALLTSDEMLQDVDFQKLFAEVVAEKDRAIHSQHTKKTSVKEKWTSDVRIGGFRAYGKGGKRGVRKREKLGRKIDQSKRKMDERVSAKEASFRRSLYRDLLEIFKKDVHKDNAICIVNPRQGSETLLTALAMANARRYGKKYVLSAGNDQQYMQHLYDDLSSFLIDTSMFKSDRTEIEVSAPEKAEDETHKKKSEKKYRGPVTPENYLPPYFRERIGEFFMKQLTDQDWYENGFRTEASYFAEEFFLYWNLFAVSGNLADNMAGIKKNSLNVVIIDQAFNDLAEEDKQRFLWAADRALRVGGKIFFYETAYTQTAIEYYGAELFDQKYEYSKPKLEQGARWLILQKKTNEMDMSSLRPLHENKAPVANEEQTGDPTGDSEIIEVGDEELGTGEEISHNIVSNEERQRLNREETGLVYTVEQIAWQAGVNVGDVYKRLHAMGINRKTRSNRASGKKYASLTFSASEVKVIIEGLPKTNKRESI